MAPKYKVFSSPHPFFSQTNGAEKRTNGAEKRTNGVEKRTNGVQRREQMVQRREQMVQRRESVLWGHRRPGLLEDEPTGMGGAWKMDLKSVMTVFSTASFCLVLGSLNVMLMSVPLYIGAEEHRCNYCLMLYIVVQLIFLLLYMYYPR